MKTKTKAIHIDAENKRVLPIEIGSLEDMQKAVGGYIETAARFKQGDYLFVDEEGLLKPVKFGFGIQFPGTGDAGIYAGNGLITGPADEDGNETDTTITIEEIEKQIEFLEAL
jgi:hypothetical protein